VLLREKKKIIKLIGERVPIDKITKISFILNYFLSKEIYFFQKKSVDY